MHLCSYIWVVIFVLWTILEVNWLNLILGEEHTCIDFTALALKFVEVILFYKSKACYPGLVRMCATSSKEKPPGIYSLKSHIKAIHEKNFPFYPKPKGRCCKTGWFEKPHQLVCLLVETSNIFMFNSN